MTKEKAIKILILYLLNNKDVFIIETKKIISEIKNSSINLSAKLFDEHAIDAFAHQIWKNFPQFCDLFVNLGINQNIQIRSDITGGYWGKFKFQIIGEKTKFKKNKSLKPFNFDNYKEGRHEYVKKIIDNEQEKNKYQLIVNNYDKNQYFVEKIYNYDKSIYEASFTLTKEKAIDIIKIFLYNTKENFIIETKKIISEIKNSSINLSAKAFDEHAIDAFAHQISENFTNFFYLSVNLGINQNIQIRSDITGGYWGKFKFQIIGEKTNSNKKLIKPTITSHDGCDNQKNKKLNEKSNISEKWYKGSKMKIKINKFTWIKILSLFLITSDKVLFINNLINLFNIFPNNLESYDKLNKEDCKIFSNLILQNFTSYHNAFLKLKNDESIRITSYSNYPDGYWKNNDFEKYNEIVDKNNDVIDWTTFNDRKWENIQKKKKISHEQDFDLFNREKRPNNNIYDVPGDHSCLFWSLATSYLLPVRNNDIDFRNRFIRLFGEENINNLSYIQNLFNNFDLNNHLANQNLYIDEIAKNLFTKVFRNRIVDYIETHRDMFELDINAEGYNFDEYLSFMRSNQSWGGAIEAAAASYIFETQLFINETRLRNENFENFIQIFHHGTENHYNFYFSNELTINSNNEPEAGSSKEKLYEVIKNNELGNLPDIKQKTILDKIKEKNPKIKIEETEITQIFKDFAIISSKPSSTNYISSQSIIFFSPLNEPFIINNSNLYFPDINNQIDIQNNWKYKIRSQGKTNLCGIAILQNLAYNVAKQNVEEWNKKNPNLKFKDITIENIKKFLKENITNKKVDIDKEGISDGEILTFLKKFIVGYSIFELKDSFIINQDERLRIVQSVVGQSLLLNTPVVVGSSLYKDSTEYKGENVSHYFIIIGIYPNKDPLKTIYIVRNSATETIDFNCIVNDNFINGKQLIGMLSRNSTYDVEGVHESILFINAQITRQHAISLIDGFRNILSEEQIEEYKKNILSMKNIIDYKNILEKIMNQHIFSCYPNITYQLLVYYLFFIGNV